MLPNKEVPVCRFYNKLLFFLPWGYTVIHYQIIGIAKKRSNKFNIICLNEKSMKEDEDERKIENESYI